MTQLYVVGKYVLKHELGVIWDFQGIFDTSKKAEDACETINHFVGPVPLNEQLPESPVVWPDCYYPNR